MKFHPFSHLRSVLSWRRPNRLNILMGVLILFLLIVFLPASTQAQQNKNHKEKLLWLPASSPTSFSAISGGISSHTCVLTSGGGVKCWGLNMHGQLGDGTTANRISPVDVIGLESGVIAIETGGAHTCALTSGGGVKCWGWNAQGQLGDGTIYSERYTPVDVIGLASGITAIGAGGMNTCALTSGGGVKCWGWGSGDIIPVDVIGLETGIIALSQGSEHTCVLTSSGGVKCWGANIDGQLGNGTSDYSNIPVDVIGLGSGVTAIEAGGKHTCALIAAGGVKCWGANEYGQLSDGTFILNRYIPVDVVGLESDITALSLGRIHTCVLTAGGGVKCWGANGSGQLGDGTTTVSRIPLDVTGLGIGVTAVTTGVYHSCALTNGGGAMCWGWNGHGQLGDGTILPNSIPISVGRLGSGITAIEAGKNQTCALTAVGGMKCWGSNLYGKLGDGTDINNNIPVGVSGLESGVTAFDTGEEHTCALSTGGEAMCWGDNRYGQLGNGTISYSSNLPVNVIGLGNGVTALAAGAFHTCALTAVGGVMCWGNNEDGQLGDGTNYSSLVPVNVIGLGSSVTALSVGGAHTCALTAVGGVKCWGLNEYGQLGDGTSTYSSTLPVDVIGLENGVIAIDAGGAHTCVLTSSGGVKCWGNNEDGQLGDGTINNSNLPVDVIGLESGVIELATSGTYYQAWVGGYHTCALTTGGGVKCWGSNVYGQLGDGTTANRNTPVNVSGLESGVTAITTGGMHSCAIIIGGLPKCWGWDYDGQLGVEGGAIRLMPVNVQDEANKILLNYLNGQPGSFFTVTGQNFPPGSPITLTINNVVMSQPLQTNETGGFIFFLDTLGAEAGGYLVTVSVNSGPSASNLFLLNDATPLRSQEGGGQTVNVPSGIGVDYYFTYIPIIRR